VVDTDGFFSIKYRDRALQLIEQKAEGKQITGSSRQEPAVVVDLMEALKLVSPRPPLAARARRAEPAPRKATPTRR
jgi:non-homologous end joining protein Ku